MKAVLYREGSPVLSELPEPEIGPGEALISVDACGLCGTDIMKLGTKPERAVLGHELAGRIVKLRGVAGFSEGDRVVVAHHVPCLNCHFCRKKSWSMCAQFKQTNIDPGGFSERVRVSALHARHTMLKIPDGLEAEAASQTEPLACCLRNAKRLELGPGDAVGIIGLGAIGQLTARLLRRRFECAVFGLDLDESRAAALHGFGLGFTDAAAFEREMRSATEGRGLDALIVSAGTPAMAAQRLPWLRDGGTLNVFASFHPDPRMSLDLNAVYHRELSVVASYSPGLEDLRESLELIAGGLPVDLPTQRTFGLEEFPAAVEAVRGRKVMKAILSPLVRA